MDILIWNIVSLFLGIEYTLKLARTCRELWTIRQEKYKDIKRMIEPGLIEFAGKYYSVSSEFLDSDIRISRVHSMYVFNGFHLYALRPDIFCGLLIDEHEGPKWFTLAPSGRSLFSVTWRPIMQFFEDLKEQGIVPKFINLYEQELEKLRQKNTMHISRAIIKIDQDDINALFNIFRDNGHYVQKGPRHVLIHDASLHDILERLPMHYWNRVDTALEIIGDVLLFSCDLVQPPNNFGYEPISLSAYK